MHAVLASDVSRDPDDVSSFSNASDIVELIVLTADETFLQTLREAVGASRRLWHVPSADKVSDLLVAGQVGILVLDTQALHESAGVFVGEIKRQFPDLVVVVAGTRDAEATLAALISSGLVYRFIHKPMSPARARLFADAAVKKYQEHRSRAAASRRLRRTGLGKGRLAAGAGAIALAILLAAYGLHEHAAGPGKTPRSPVPSVASQTARDGPAVAAPAGLAEVRERLLAQAENALLEERLDDAANAIAVARNAGVEAGRIAFLSAQLARSRERRSASQSAAPHGKDEPHAAEPQGATAPQRHDPLLAAGQSAPATPSPSAVQVAPRQQPVEQGPAQPPPDAALPQAAAPPPAPPIPATRSDIVDASALTLLRSVPPTYPVKAALAGTEGWVELDFTVLANGTVKNITVHAANPAGVFEDAGKTALSRWHYAPVLRDGRAAEQRARIRLRFTLRN
jgi:TonB family protein